MSPRDSPAPVVASERSPAPVVDANDSPAGAAQSGRPAAGAVTRITWTLFVGQGLAQAAILAIFPLFAIVGAALGRPGWAGLPAMVYALSSALSAFGWGLAMDRVGRRPVLVAGFLLGTGGALLAGQAVLVSGFLMFQVGLALVGAAMAAITLGRFVAGEIHPAERRGRAISRVVLGGTAGAVLAPLVVRAITRGASGQSEFISPFWAAAALYGVAAAAMAAGIWPEPRLLAGGRVGLATRVPRDGRSLWQILRGRAVRVAVVAMVVGQLVMAMVMVMTSVHMRDHHHPLPAIALVLSLHVVGMYAFSMVSGRLADRWGRAPVITGGAAALLLSCLAAPLSPALGPTAAALFLLGLGWNFCFVGGSALLADQLTDGERGRVQGFNDLLVGAASGAGSLGSGALFAAAGFAVMALAAALLALVPLGLTWWWMATRRVAADASTA